MSRKHTAESSSAALRAPWRKNFTTLAPIVRRAARYALQIVARNPNLHHRFADDDFLGALWSLTLPLLDPAKLARLQADWMRPDSEISRVSTAMPAVAVKASTIGSSDCVARNGASSVSV